MYDCSYNYNSNNNNYNRYDDEIEEDTFTSYVYTMGWDTYGTDYVWRTSPYCASRSVTDPETSAGIEVDGKE